MTQISNKYDSELITSHDLDIRKPKPYNVVLYNDNYTTMDFVIYILEKIFHHSNNVAKKIMLDVHERGKGVAGTYTRDIAETKASQTRTIAKEYSYPLKCVAEPA